MSVVKPKLQRLQKLLRGKEIYNSDTMRVKSKSAQTAQSARIARKTRVTKSRLVLVFNLIG